MIFTKEDVSISDEKVERLTREYNIHYRACIGSLVYLLSTRVDLSFAVHKLEKFSANPGKVHFEGLVHLLSYIRYNKTFGLKLVLLRDFSAQLRMSFKSALYFRPKV